MPLRVLAPGSDPDLQHVLERRLRVHQVGALQLDLQALPRALEMMAVGAGEVPKIITAQLAHVKTRAHMYVAVGVHLLDHHVRD